MRHNSRATFCSAFVLLALGLFGVDRAVAGWWWTAPADVPGRWVLDSRTYCALSFSGAPYIPHGTVTATGFCPRVFLARPRWWFDDAGHVVIGKRHGDPLAVLAVGRGRLDGQIATGETVLLTR